MLDVVFMFSNKTLQLSTPKQPAYIINTIVEESSNVFEENCSTNIDKYCYTVCDEAR